MSKLKTLQSFIKYSLAKLGISFIPIVFNVFNRQYHAILKLVNKNVTKIVTIVPKIKDTKCSIFADSFWTQDYKLK